MKPIGIAVIASAFTISACTTTNAPDTARTEVARSLANMGAAANAHDVDRHVGFYAHEPSTLLIFNGEAVVGWDAIRAKQTEWWNDGKTDVVYTLQGRPDIRVLAPGLVVTTIFMKSRRSAPAGAIKEGSFAVSALWQKRAEGWKVIYSHESTTQ